MQKIARSFGCLSLISLTIGIAAAVVIVLAHGGRVAYVIAAFAGFFAIACAGAYVVLRVAGLAVAMRAATAHKPTEPHPSSRPLACNRCGAHPPLWLCVVHSAWLCHDCAPRHNASKLCQYVCLSPPQTVTEGQR